MKEVSVVTGALGALGRPIAAELARRGRLVVLVGRTEERLERARWEIASSCSLSAIETLACDLASIASVQAAASALARRHPRIDTLVHCAATFTATRRTSRDGHELMVATNHLAPYLLTRLLEGPLVAARDARIVCMTMPSTKPPALDDLMSERRFFALEVFAMSKAMNQYFVRELAARWGSAASVFAVNPTVTRTTLVREAPLPLRIAIAVCGASPEDSIESTIHAATSPSLAGRTGLYFGAEPKETFMPASADERARALLWERSAELVGLARVGAAS